MNFSADIIDNTQLVICARDLRKSFLHKYEDFQSPSTNTISNVYMLWSYSYRFLNLIGHNKPTNQTIIFNASDDLDNFLGTLEWMEELAGPHLLLSNLLKAIFFYQF